MLGLLGLGALVYELFGTEVLHLYAKEGVFISGVGPLRKRCSFPLDCETYARVDEHLKGGLVNSDVPVRDLMVVGGVYEEARFGRTMPLEVQEYIVKCIARRAAGRTLVSVKGPFWRPNIAHPLLFVLLLALVVCFAGYSFSGYERTTVRDGVVEITESKWWGSQVSETKIPVADISRVEWTSGGRSYNSRELRFIGKGDRLIMRLTGFGPEVGDYGDELGESLSGSPSPVFDHWRNTTRISLIIAAFLLLPLALSCGMDGFKVVVRRKWAESLSDV